ncbi:TraB/GumN family protein [Thalassotalea agarivorans]|uniref:TraB family protein n=1 Tax=Thalassotalea agarivorans TaxID=349064 RepID=A0A1I0CLZ7_THASX|nr:TraB/GumN family protein [Thalassotalea agarivorans]SET20701.1 hypothetical protein SAMN05660429_01251 [Thalassotalea agarivorans]
MSKLFFTRLLMLTTFFISSVSLAQTSIWKVSKGDDYFYLGGTIHMLSASDHPLPSQYAEAYKASNSIIFETDLDATTDPQFQAKMMQMISYQDGRTLDSELTEETYKRLKAFTDSREIPLDMFKTLKPWGVTLMITVLEYQRLGMMPTYGIDNYFNVLAKQDGKKIGGLETPEEQLGFLSSMGTIEPNKSVNYTLRDLERLPEFIESMKQTWRSGELEKFSEHAFIEEMKTEYPAVYNALLKTRNNNWIAPLQALSNNGDTEFVLVGAMHIPGEDGLLTLLKAKGYTLEQL